MKKVQKSKDPKDECHGQQEQKWMADKPNLELYDCHEQQQGILRCDSAKEKRRQSTKSSPDSRQRSSERISNSNPRAAAKTTNSTKRSAQITSKTSKQFNELMKPKRKLI